MRDLLYVTVVVLLSAVILFRPWWGILAWTVFGLVNPQEFTYHSQTFRFALLLGGATLIGMLLTRDRKRIPLTSQTVILVLLALWFTLTTLQAWAQDVAWEQWEKVIKILLMALATTMLIYGRKRIMTLLVTLVVVLGFFGVKGGIFTIVTGGENRVNGPGDNGYISGNSGIGVALLMILPLVLVMAQRQKSAFARVAIWVSFWLMTIGAVFTYSRGVLLGLGCVMFALFFKVKRKALVFVLVLPALFAAYQYVPGQLISRAETIETYQEDGSSMARIQAWGVAFNVARSNPLGAGFGFDTLRERWLEYANFRDEEGNFSYARTAHSIYFQMLGDHGFVGLILQLMLLASTYLALGRVSKHAASLRGTSQAVADVRSLGRYAEGLQVGLIGYAIAGAFFSMAYFDLYYAFVALTVIMQRECREAMQVGDDRPVSTGRSAQPPQPTSDIDWQTDALRTKQAHD